jgi:hypothetical protein
MELIMAKVRVGISASFLLARLKLRISRKQFNSSVRIVDHLGNFDGLFSMLFGCKKSFRGAMPTLAWACSGIFRGYSFPRSGVGTQFPDAPASEIC